jgi:hypothetical protein
VDIKKCVCVGKISVGCPFCGGSGIAIQAVGTETLEEVATAWCRWVASRLTRAAAARQLQISVPTLLKRLAQSDLRVWAPVVAAEAIEAPAPTIPAGVTPLLDEDDEPAPAAMPAQARPAPRALPFSPEEMTELSQRPGEAQDAWLARVKETRQRWGK